MAEFTSKAIQFIGNTPGAGIEMAYVTGASAVNSDTFTVSGLTTVKGAFLISTTGVVGTMTFATNVITVTNGGALTWTGLAWGVP
jgi:hypothetical protein